MNAKRTVLQLTALLGVLFSLLIGSVLLDRIPLSAAKPPKDLRTIEEFRAWKGGTIQGKGEFEDSGVVYTVMMAPAGRYLA
jgi:hypothetical protein